MMEFTDREVRESESGYWSARCKVDGVVRYATSRGGFDATADRPDDGRDLILVEDLETHLWCRWPDREGAALGLRQAIQNTVDLDRQHRERQARAERLAVHPNGGWDPA